MINNKRFQKTVLATSIMAALVAFNAQAYAQESSPSKFNNAALKGEVRLSNFELESLLVAASEGDEALILALSDFGEDLKKINAAYLQTLGLVEAESSSLILKHYRAVEDEVNSSWGAGTYIGIGLGGLGLAALAVGGGSGGGSELVSVGTGNNGGDGGTGGNGNPPVNDSGEDIFKDLEYSFTGGMELTKIRVAHDRGFTGKNAKVAVLDTGVNSDHEDLIGQFSGFYNAFTQSELESDAQDLVGHGTHVSGIIASKQNEQMSVGYAPDADMLMIKIADENGRLTLSDIEEADAFWWARKQGADFINNSWGVDETARDITANQAMLTMPNLISEFKVGAANDVVYVWANGNNGGNQPGLHSGLPSLFPELKANWVTVANVDSDTGLIHWSSQHCGDAAAWCISAPGTDINAPSQNLDYATTEKTGTSMAAPAVTGALASLKDAFPMLTNTQIVQRLFTTANKMGVYAEESIYGQGLMDMDAASQPLGDLNALSLSGEATPLSSTTLNLGRAFGTENPLQGVEVMAVDAQGAGFYEDLGRAVVSQTFSYDAKQALNRLEYRSLDKMKGANDMSIAFTSSGSSEIGFDNLIVGFNEKSSMPSIIGLVDNVDRFMGVNSLVGQTQQDVSLSSPFFNPNKENDGDKMLMGAKQGFNLGFADLEMMAISGEQNKGLSVAISHDFNGYRSSVEMGQSLNENGLFGTKSGGALSLGNAALTRFIGLRGEADIGALHLYHSAYIGQSQGQSDSGVVSKMGNVLASSWMVGGHFEENNNRIGMLVSQPLRVESAPATLSFVDGYKDGEYTSKSVDVNFAPKGRQINSEVFYSFSGDNNKELKVSLMRMDNPGHNKSSREQHSIMATYKMTF